jgi:hypothetical protein
LSQKRHLLRGLVTRLARHFPGGDVRARPEARVLVELCPAREARLAFATLKVIKHLRKLRTFARDPDILPNAEAVVLDASEKARLPFG